jgi:GNAT superfamily N-acetyltransferase
MSYQFCTLAERPELHTQLSALDRAAWPRFMMEDPAEKAHWEALLEHHAQLQVLLHDSRDTVLAAGYAVPVEWNGTLSDLPEGWNAALSRGFDRDQSLGKPDTVSALSVVVHPDYQGMGLSREVIFEMKLRASREGFVSIIVPLRPSLKSQYPLIPIERYLQWKREDGLPFDPWVRTHTRMGAELLRIAPRSMVIPGTVADWEGWTGMQFPESGSYVVPGALQPVTIDRERDLGLYEEPNVWMHHDVSTVNRMHWHDLRELNSRLERPSLQAGSPQP